MITISCDKLHDYLILKSGKTRLDIFLKMRNSHDAVNPYKFQESILIWEYRYDSQYR